MTYETEINPMDFQSWRGDRVARKPGASENGPINTATKDFGEALIYATERARILQRRQRLLRHIAHGWYLVIDAELTMHTRIRRTDA
jgi:hypothetical protein